MLLAFYSTEYANSRSRNPLSDGTQICVQASSSNRWPCTTKFNPELKRCAQNRDRVKRYRRKASASWNDAASYLPGSQKAFRFVAAPGHATSAFKGDEDGARPRIGNPTTARYLLSPREVSVATNVMAWLGDPAIQAAFSTLDGRLEGGNEGPDLYFPNFPPARDRRRLPCTDLSWAICFLSFFSHLPP
jgi:hypothetical protein